VLVEVVGGWCDGGGFSVVFLLWKEKTKEV